MTSPLDRLASIGNDIHVEAFDREEYDGLVVSGRARLLDAERRELAIESRFDLAYNASHALSLAALRRAGYRSSKRYIVFQALQHTLDIAPEVWRIFDKCHRIRNQGEYEGLLDVDDRLVDDLIAASHLVLTKLESTQS